MDGHGKKYKVLFVLPNLSLGGAERVTVNLLRYLDRCSFEVVLCLVKKEGPLLDELPEDIQVIDLDKKRVRGAFFALASVIVRERPDLVFSTITHLNVMVGLVKIFTKGNGTRFVVRESGVPQSQISTNKIIRLVSVYCYKQTDLIIAQCQQMKQEFILSFGIPEEKLKIVRNPLDIDDITQKSRVKSGVFRRQKTNLLAVGRFSFEKGFDLLMEAFALLESSGYHLIIIGSGDEGGEKKRLKDLRQSFSLEGCVDFIEDELNPYPYMREADMLLLTSRTDAFPNVVIEANACGTPVIAFNCSGGVSEIITNGVNGSLVEYGNIKEFANSISTFRKSDYEPMKILEKTRENFDARIIAEAYGRLFLQVIQKTVP